MVEGTQEDVADRVAETLDADYIGSVARAVASAIRADEPIEVNYQPGDSTRYGLVFVPIRELACAPGVRYHGREWDARVSFGVARTGGACMIAWIDHGATALDLAVGGYDGGYIAGLFRESLWTGHALAALFDAITSDLGAR